MDLLISNLISDNNRYNDNFIQLMSRMVILGYGQEFYKFLFDIVDQGYFVEFQNGDYDYNNTLKQFDTSLRMEDKIKVLEIVGNDMFDYFASEDYVWKENLVMITSLIRMVMDCHLYVNIEHSNIKYNEKFM